MNLIRWQNKLSRTINMLLDNSEHFNDYPMFRYKIIADIWKEK